MKISIIAFLAIILICGCANEGANNAALQSKIDSLQNELKKFTDEKATTDQRLIRFDSLDYCTVISSPAGIVKAFVKVARAPLRILALIFIR